MLIVRVRNTNGVVVRYGPFKDRPAVDLEMELKGWCYDSDGGYVTKEEKKKGPRATVEWIDDFESADKLPRADTQLRT